MRKVLWY